MLTNHFSDDSIAGNAKTRRWLVGTYGKTSAAVEKLPFRSSGVGGHCRSIAAELQHIAKTSGVYPE
jgi:hypothetical protein